MASTMLRGMYIIATHVDNNHMEGGLDLSWQVSDVRPEFSTGICSDGTSFRNMDGNNLIRCSESVGEVSATHNVLLLNFHQILDQNGMFPKYFPVAATPSRNAGPSPYKASAVTQKKGNLPRLTAFSNNSSPISGFVLKPLFGHERSSFDQAVAFATGIAQIPPTMNTAHVGD